VGQRVFTASVRSVNLDISSGSVTLERSSGPNTIVTSSGSRGLTIPSDHEAVSKGVLVILSSCGASLFSAHCNRNYTLRVEATDAVTVNTGNGNIDIVRTGGALNLSSGQGDVTVTGKHRSLRASSGQGNVSASALGAGSTSAVSGQGDVDLRFLAPPDKVSASSGQGNVDIELPPGFSTYQVHISSGQGSATNEVAESTGSTKVIRATSGQGDVDVHYGAG
jgi:hypothetical protein